MLVLVLGAQGMLGYDITKALANGGIPHISLGKLHLDIFDEMTIRRFLKDYKVTHLINCAAYTNVGLAEKQPEKAMDINRRGVENLVSACENYQVKLMHFSTDYVFDGEKTSAYLEDDKPNPINVYGLTKLGGEDAIRDHCQDYKIFRLQWLYGKNGNNFVSKILETFKSRGHCQVVSDQYGSPCSTIFISNILMKVIYKWDEMDSGIYHLTHDDYCSWFQFTQYIFEVLDMPCDIEPISYKDYPASVKRPANSIMDNSKLKRALNETTLGDWRSDLKNYLINHRDQFSFLWK